MAKQSAVAVAEPIDLGQRIGEEQLQIDLAAEKIIERLAHDVDDALIGFEQQAAVKELIGRDTTENDWAVFRRLNIDRPKLVGLIAKRRRIERHRELAGAAADLVAAERAIKEADQLAATVLQKLRDEIAELEMKVREIEQRQAAARSRVDVMKQARAALRTLVPERIQKQHARAHGVIKNSLGRECIEREVHILDQRLRDPQADLLEDESRLEELRAQRAAAFVEADKILDYYVPN